MIRFKQWGSLNVERGNAANACARFGSSDLPKYVLTIIIIVIIIIISFITIICITIVSAITQL